MTKPTFYRDQPISFGCQVKTTAATPVPVDMTAFASIEFVAKHALTGGKYSMAVQRGDETGDQTTGIFSATITDPSAMPIGDYVARAKLFDAAGVPHPSNVEKAFTILDW